MNRRCFAALLLCSLLCGLLLLPGCTAVPQASDGRLRIVATIFPPYDFARQLTGELAEVTMLAAPGTEAHDFVPTLTDLSAIAGCDLLLYIGGETDAWAVDALDSLGDAAPRSLSLCSLVQTVDEALLEGMEDEGDEEEDEPDEHVWTSPRNAIAICEGITAALRELDPAHAADYDANLSAYTRQLQTLDDAFADVMARSMRQTAVFAERFPFRYLADELGLTCYAAFKGCSSSTEPSLATISFLTEQVKSQGLPVVFYIEFSDQKVADTICAATGAEKRLLHSCHNVSPEDFAAGITYLELMTRNVESLRAALD